MCCKRTSCRTYTIKFIKKGLIVLYEYFNNTKFTRVCIEHKYFTYRVRILTWNNSSDDLKALSHLQFFY